MLTLFSYLIDIHALQEQAAAGFDLWRLVRALLVVLSLLLAIAALLYAVYIRLKSRLYTRERYAFAALSAVVTLTVLCVTTVTITTPWDAALETFYILMKNSQAPSPTSWSEKLLVVFFVAYAVHQIFRVFHKWDGVVSVRQKELEDLYKRQTLLREGFEELVRRLQGAPSPQAYDTEGNRPKPPPVSAPEDSLAWRDQVRELITLTWPSYAIDEDEGWHERAGCWVGQNTKTQATVGVLCPVTNPSDQDLVDFATYVQRLPETNGMSLELFAVTQAEQVHEQRPAAGHRIECISEAYLLDGLVDFSDYFRHIKRRVERDSLPDVDFEILDTYVPTRVRRSDGEVGEETQDLEHMLSQWAEERGQRHIALLGEYGQGKSTSMLVYSYHLIEQIEKGADVRIPILVELRGMTPSSLSPLKLFGAWASEYKIKARALMRLLVAGRLLIIFEGFDEMASATTEEQRLNHFRALWKFAYPKAKLIITGRPNFFLDDRELAMALGIARGVTSGPYCEAFALQPFTLDQMKAALRWASYRDEIIALATGDEKFREVVSRPSLLYIIGVLWQEEKLQERGIGINAASVIELFVRYSLRRQTEKHRKGQRFMALNESEREFFFMGIAAYMAVNKLKNQISRQQFDEIISRLYEVVPSKLDALAAADEDARPLSERLRGEPKPAETVRANVRTYGLLVWDPAQKGALRFAHKSFFELLYAKYVYARLKPEDWSRAIYKTTGAGLRALETMPEALDFLAEKVSSRSGDQATDAGEVRTITATFEEIFAPELSPPRRLLLRIIYVIRGIHRYHVNTLARHVILLFILFMLASVPIVIGETVLPEDDYGARRMVLGIVSMLGLLGFYFEVMNGLPTGEARKPNGGRGGGGGVDVPARLWHRVAKLRSYMDANVEAALGRYIASLISEFPSRGRKRGG